MIEIQYHVLHNIVIATNFMNWSFEQQQQKINHLKVWEACLNFQSKCWKQSGDFKYRIQLAFESLAAVSFQI